MSKEQMSNINLPKFTYNGVELIKMRLFLSTKTKKYVLCGEIYGTKYYIINSLLNHNFYAINHLNDNICKFDHTCYKNLCTFIHNKFNNPEMELEKITKLFERFQSSGIIIKSLTGFPRRTYYNNRDQLHTMHGDPFAVIDRSGSTSISHKRYRSLSRSRSRSRSRVMKPFREFERLPSRSRSRSRSRSPHRERQSRYRSRSRSPHRERQYTSHMQVNNKTNILSIRVDEYINKMKQDLDYFSQNSYQYPNSEIIKKIISSNLEMMNMIHQQL
jgi:hypothetical protein